MKQKKLTTAAKVRELERKIEVMTHELQMLLGEVGRSLKILNEWGQRADTVMVMLAKAEVATHGLDEDEIKALEEYVKQYDGNSNGDGQPQMDEQETVVGDTGQTQP